MVGLEGDRDVRRQAEQRLARDQERVVEGIGVPLEQDAADGPGQPPAKDQIGKDRRPDAHGGVEAVDDEGGVGVPAAESRVADLLRARQQLIDVVERDEVAVELAPGRGWWSRLRHRSPPRRASPLGHIAVVVAVTGLAVECGRHHPLDLGHADHRQKADEEQEQREEQPEAAGEGQNVDDRRPVVAPAGGQEVPTRAR